jgi:hypothetical protein
MGCRGREQDLDHLLCVGNRRPRRASPWLRLRIARLFHLIRGSASEAFKIDIDTPCDDQQDTGKHSTLYVPGGAGNRPVIAPDSIVGGGASIGVEQELGDQPI